MVMLVLALVSCGGADRSTVEVMDAYVWPGNVAVGLTVASCNASPSVELVEQSAREVRVQVEADTPGPDQDGCADGVVACLDEPLGDRTLIDDTSGETVPLSAGYEEPSSACPD